MRKEEITTGMELYYDPAAAWEQMPSALACRAVVVDAEKGWKFNEEFGASGVNDMWITAPRARGVLVDLHMTEGAPQRMVVQPLHLRGPYQETAERVATAREAYDEDTERLRRQRAQERALRQELRERMNDLFTTERPNVPGGVMTVPLPIIWALIIHAEMYEVRWSAEELQKDYDRTLNTFHPAPETLQQEF